MFDLPPSGPDPKRILIVLHQEHSTPGRVGRLLKAMGYQLDTRRPRFGDPLPRTLANHAAAIVFGGPMSANDNEGWIKDEIDWINVALKENKPFLGICLGAQMLARCLGHKVSPHPEGRVEIGYYPVDATEHGRSLCEAHFPDHVYHWHREGFECPRDAVLLAAGEHFETQAIRVGDNAYGFQFHPEVTYAMMCKWTCHGAERLAAPGARARHHHLEGWYMHDAKVARWTEDFLRGFVG